jgi:tetratricopeptide (TPR) repeat protein
LPITRSSRASAAHRPRIGRASAAHRPRIGRALADPARLAPPQPRRHTRRVRWPLLLCCALAAAAPVAAQPGPPRPAPAPPRAHVNVWEELTDPNAEQVRILLAKARLSMRRADDALAGDTEWAADARARFYRDAYHLAAYARTRAPEHLDALAVFARAADELGKTSEALAALEQYTKLAGPDAAPAEVTGRLGAIYLRRGDTERAIRWLRRAQGPLSALGGRDQAHAIVLLAGALAARGDTGAAVHALLDALPERAIVQLSPEAVLVAFALAVVYDRDEQRSAAFEVLDLLQTTLGATYRELVQIALARMAFVPAEDLHYFRALLYESQGHAAEARAEWALYAAAGDPPFRGRALDHIAALDAGRRTPGAKASQQPAPPRTIPRRLPTP